MENGELSFYPILEQFYPKMQKIPLSLNFLTKENGISAFFIATYLFHFV
jgi:hypothetical protein